MNKEKNELIKSIKEDIAGKNLKIFGDPCNPKYLGKLDRVNKLAREVLDRANKTIKDIFDIHLGEDISELIMKYEKLIKIYEGETSPKKEIKNR